jgi:cyclophilin family peptidyl-prolyl cis-trans isomerase
MPVKAHVATRVILLALIAAAWALPAWSQAPGATVGPQQVRIETTLGAFTVELDVGRAPISAANFLQYVRDRHYDGTMFHRVISNFMIQGGGHLPDGAEKPPRAGIPNESGNGLSNRRGTVAMARTGDPHSGNAQFFVNVADNIALDPSPARWGYAVFGRVVEGMDVVDRIASVATGARAGFAEDTPLEPVLIVSARVVGEADSAK